MQIRVMTTAAVFASFLLTGGALAAPPGPGQHFDCSDGGTSSCATDDEGCVPAAPLAYKCSNIAWKIIAKAVKGAFSCHAKQVQMRFQGSSESGAGNSEENCEENPGNSVKSKFDAGVSKLTALGCNAGFVSGVSTFGTTLFGSGPGSFDGDNGNAYCDSTSGALIGDDDTGSVPQTASIYKCEVSVAKGLAALRVNVLKCHGKMGAAFFKGYDFAEEDCEEVSPTTGKGALAKFNALRDKLVAANICPPCLSASAMDGLAASTLSTEDANNDVAFPCP